MKPRRALDEEQDASSRFENWLLLVAAGLVLYVLSDVVRVAWRVWWGSR